MEVNAMDFQIDKQKALELAKEIGLEIFFDDKKSGVIMETGEHKDFVEFFPELNYLYNQENFITKDSGELFNLSKNIFIKLGQRKVPNVLLRNDKATFPVENNEKWHLAS